MGQNILNEREANQQVISNLLREIARLKGKKNMARIVLFKDINDGKIKQAQQYEEVSRQEILDALKDTETQHQALTQALNDFDNYTADDESTETAPATDTTAADPAPETETPAPVEAAPAPEPVAQPEQPATPIEVTPAPTAEAPQPTPITIQ
jgi:cell division protein FtsN